MSTVLVLHDYLEVLWCLAMYEGFVKPPHGFKGGRAGVFKRDKTDTAPCYFIIRPVGNEDLRFISEQIESILDACFWRHQTSETLQFNLPRSFSKNETSSFSYGAGGRLSKRSPWPVSLFSLRKKPSVSVWRPLSVATRLHLFINMIFLLCRPFVLCGWRGNVAKVPSFPLSWLIFFHTQSVNSQTGSPDVQWI